MQSVPEAITVPDAIEPAMGWRTWIVEETVAGWRLRSVIYPATWRPCERLAADCRRSNVKPVESHFPPALACNCGVHAGRTPAELRSYCVSGQRWPGSCETALPRPIGVVALWGRVVEHEKGFRGTYAYPRRLYVPAGARCEEIALALTDYGVPVALLDVDASEAIEALAGEDPL
jgi:hypothetical protein